MICPVFAQTVPLAGVNRREILRYAGVKTITPEISCLMEESLAQAMPVISGKVCWARFPLVRKQGILDLSFAQTGSEVLKQNLEGCEEVLVFGATIGLSLDRMILRYGQTSPSKALMLQAIGTERIENLCDVFCEMRRQEAALSGYYPVPRFSPGYGDFPLELQKDIFRVLDCPRKIGLTLNDSLIMSPSKSVTAIVGLRRCPGSSGASGCRICAKTDCIYRRSP